MSYVRFNEDGSDVSVYLNGADHLECGCCLFHPRAAAQQFDSTQAMIDHLRKHQRWGHTVPLSVFERLKADRDTNDAKMGASP